MTDNILNKEKNQAELEKYRDLVLATIDYYLDKVVIQIKTEDYDYYQYFNGFKSQTEEHFQKGRLSRLKQWFSELSEMPIENRDLKFNEYLKNKTKYDIDIFQAYYQRIDKIIEKGKITSDSQFYDVNSMVNQLCQTEPADNNRIGILNKLLINYEQRKSRNRKPTA